MLGRLRGWLAGGRQGAQGGKGAARANHEGLEIVAEPVVEGPVWRVAGRIQRVGDDGGPAYRFVRADTMASHAEAVHMSLIKGRQLIDERGRGVLPGVE